VASQPLDVLQEILAAAEKLSWIRDNSCGAPELYRCRNTGRRLH
jgi:hypothetical protein